MYLNFYKLIAFLLTNVETNFSMKSGFHKITKICKLFLGRVNDKLITLESNWNLGIKLGS